MSDNSSVAPGVKDNATGTVNVRGEGAENSDNETVFASGSFAGKTVSQVEQEFANFRQMSGHQANELGEIRKQLAEMKAKRNDVPAMSHQAIGELAETDPTKMITELEKRITGTLTEKINLSSKSSKAEMLLLSKHPDKDAIVSSPEFKQWESDNGVLGFSGMATEKYRNDGDSSGLSFLLDRYKDATGKTAQDKVDAAKAAGSVSTTGITPKSTVQFTRQEIAKMSDADRKANHEAIVKGYAEGTIK